MKYQFGSFLSRLLWGGVTLSPLELQVLQTLVGALPSSLRHVVEAQFDAYNLAQRESDGRALNFYRKRKSTGLAGDLPRIEHKNREAPLVRVTVTPLATKQPLHAVLHVVDGRAFCISFGRRPSRAEHRSAAEVDGVVEAWRSNVLLSTGNA